MFFVSSVAAGVIWFLYQLIIQAKNSKVGWVRALILSIVGIVAGLLSPFLVLVLTFTVLAFLPESLYLIIVPLIPLGIVFLSILGANAILTKFKH